ncbi:hypothetical protein K445DRAFT_316029 [Daldinia sp. EC12]|nr:hypothetical protein K445DRAFT_316029 [Daldinia sp. EC12]
MQTEHVLAGLAGFATYFLHIGTASTVDTMDTMDTYYKCYGYHQLNTNWVSTLFTPLSPHTACNRHRRITDKH